MFGSDPWSLSSGFPLVQGCRAASHGCLLGSSTMLHQHKIMSLKTRLTGSLLLLLRAYFWGSSWGIVEFPASYSGATKMVVSSGDSLTDESLMLNGLTDGRAGGVTLVAGGIA